jgi:hypothetical protein
VSLSEAGGCGLAAAPRSSRRGAEVCSHGGGIGAEVTEEGRGEVRQRLGEEGAVAGEVEPDGAHAVLVGDVDPGVGQELPERVLEKIVDLERAPAPSVLMRPTPRTAARSGETV